MPGFCGLENDVFISYAHADNTEGWITAFETQLTNRLRQLDRSAPFTIWRDQKLGGTDIFSDEIPDRLESSGVLISILSPNALASDRSLRERKSFEQAASRNGGLRLNNEARTLRITKSPCQGNKDRDLFGTAGHDFYRPAAQAGFFQEINHHSPDFEDKLLQIAQEVFALLRDLREKRLQTPAPELTVYLAAPPPNTAAAEWRQRVASELTGAWNCRILPENPDPDQLSEASISALVKDCDLSLHWETAAQTKTAADVLQWECAVGTHIKRVVCEVPVVRIFLASSSELREDRDAFELYMRQRNDELRKEGAYLEIVRWENFLDAMSETRLQDEYNNAVRGCDVFVALFATKAGKFTEEEFDRAFGEFKASGKPRIFTYFKNAEFKISSARREDLQSLWAFQDKLKGLGHYQTNYENTADLKLQFGDQLRKLIAAGGVATARVGAATSAPAGNSDERIRATAPDEIVQYFEEFIKARREAPVEVADDSPSLVYVICSPDEMDEGVLLKQCVESEHGFSAVLPISAADDGKTLLREHRRSLNFCQFAILYWGDLSKELWFREQQREIIAALTRRKGRGFQALCLASTDGADPARHSLPIIPLKRVPNLECANLRQHLDLIRKQKARKAAAR
jgi:hypothetical protein